MSRAARALVSAVFALVTIVLLAGTAVAAEDDATSLFQKGVVALRDGSLNEAVETFEALADRGFVHPDASFDRALSYLGRVRAGIEHPGDLGRAAAALEETLLLRADDRDAEMALELVRAEVARRRSRSGASADVDARPTIDRAVFGFASEWTWSILAAFSSLILTAGLVLRVVAAQMAGVGAATRDMPHEAAVHLASTIAVPIGAACLLVFAVLAVGARQLRMTTSDGVVVAPEAHLLTEKGVLSSRGAIPEAARVELGEQRGALVHVRWGALEGWTQSDAVRRLARP
ncbi:MAG TPA: hypothetical protein VK550_20920 [Polyangiaceae bacterium]|nr:hypothetical protein [Polyangiaceae bacterium]